MSSTYEKHLSALNKVWREKKNEKKQQLQSSETAALPPPVIDGLLPDLTPERPGDQKNLLPRELVAVDLPLLVTYADNGLFSTTVTGTWNGTGGIVETRVFPVGTPDQDKIINVPHHALINGVHSLIVTASSSLGSDSSAPFPLTIDLVPPNNGSALEGVDFTDEVKAGVTDALLVRDGGITGAVPRWTDIARGDRILGYWTRVSGAGTLAETGIVVDEHTIDDPALPVTLFVPEAVIRQAGEGTFGLSYRVFDRAGNNAISSTTVQIDLYVSTSPPPDFVGKEIEVFKFTPGDVIRREDIYRGVELRIPQYTYYRPGDRLDIYWNDATTPALSDIPLNNGLGLSVNLPYSVISSTGLSATDIPLWAKVKRGGSAIGTETNRLSVDVEMAVPGPAPEPGDPDPINIRFIPAVIKSDSWAGSGDDNKLLPDDEGKDAVAEVELIDGFSDGETLELMWPTILAHEAIAVRLNSPQAGDIISFPIPWTTIESGMFGPAIPVWYRVRSDDPLDGHQESRRTPVDAQTAGIKDLGPVTIEGKTTIEFPGPPAFDAYPITCQDTPWLGIRFQVPPGRGKYVGGSKFRLTFIGYAGFTGADAEVSRITFPDYEVSPTDVDIGFSYLMPFSAEVEQVLTGRAEIQYSIEDPTGRRGSSGIVNLGIYRRDGNGNECNAVF